MKKSIHIIVASFLIVGMFVAQPLAVVAEVQQVAETTIEEHTVDTSGVVPLQIYIPDLDLFTYVESVGQTSDGAMDVPNSWQNVAWYDPGFQPGEYGHAVFAAHRDWSGNQGPFWGLDDMEPGSFIVIVGENNRILVFSVVSNNSYDRYANVTERVFGVSSRPRISLITCEGTFLHDEDTYDLRRVVEAELIFDTG